MGDATAVKWELDEGVGNDVEDAVEGLDGLDLADDDGVGAVTDGGVEREVDVVAYYLTGGHVAVGS